MIKLPSAVSTYRMMKVPSLDTAYMLLSLLAAPGIVRGRDANRPFFYLRQAGGEDESVAKPLIGRLGLYEEFPAIQYTESDRKVT
jgi:hypothetical protein